MTQITKTKSFINEIVEIEKTANEERANELLSKGYILLETEKSYYDGTRGTETLYYILGRSNEIEKVEKKKSWPDEIKERG